MFNAGTASGDVDVDAAVATAEKGDRLDSLSTEGGETGVARSQLEAALDSAAVAFNKSRTEPSL